MKKKNPLPFFKMSTNLTESWGFPAAAVPMTAARAKRVNFILIEVERLRVFKEMNCGRNNEGRKNVLDSFG
jgi:hypothetical protein